MPSYLRLTIEYAAGGDSDPRKSIIFGRVNLYDSVLNEWCLLLPHATIIPPMACAVYVQSI